MLASEARLEGAHVFDSLRRCSPNRDTSAYGGGSSGYAPRALLLREPASADPGELSCRASAVAILQDDASTKWIGCAAEEAVQLAEKATRT
jgi:hypothetical protein